MNFKILLIAASFVTFPISSALAQTGVPGNF
jgi:hypothetical protein